jgi:hypothetical protein
MATSLAPFESLTLSRRKHLVDSWSYGRVSLTRKFFKPIRSVTILAFYECTPVQEALDRAGEPVAGSAAKTPAESQPENEKKLEERLEIKTEDDHPAKVGQKND